MVIDKPDFDFPKLHYEVDGNCYCPDADVDYEKHKCKKCGGINNSILKEKRRKKNV